MKKFRWFSVHYILFILCFCIVTSSVGQSPVENRSNIDSITSLPIDSTLSWMRNNYIDNIDIFPEIARHTLLRAQTIEDPLKIAEAHEEFANWNRYHGIVLRDTTLHHSEKTLEYYILTGDKTKIGKSYQTLAYDYLRDNEQDEAQEALFKALAIYEELEDEQGKAAVYQLLSVLLGQTGKPQESIDYANQAIALFKRVDDYASIAVAQFELIKGYTKLGQYEKAFHAANECIDISQTKSPVDAFSIVRAYSYRGDIYLATRDYELALKDYTKAWELCVALIGEERSRTYRTEMGNALRLQGKYQEGAEHLLAGIQAYEEDHNPNIWTLYDQLSDCYRNLDDSKKALFYFEKARTLQEKNYRDQIANLESEAIIKYETSKKEKLIEEQNDKLAKQRMTQLIALGFAALLGLLLFLSIKNARIRKQTNEQLKELDTLKNRLFTNITHEFRTPLTVITGMASQIQDNPKKWIDEGLRLIKRNGSILLDLVNQMLDLSKLESGKIQLHNQQGDIVSFLKYIVESIQSFAESEQIQIHFHAENEEIYIDFDPEKIQRIMINLLSNAVKFTPKEGHVYVNVNVESNRGLIAPAEQNRILGETDSMLQIKIRDTGMGISEDQLPYIFDRFYQVDNSATRSGEGSGIGLALVRELIKLMKGDIFVKSKFGKETEFTVLLPIRNEAPKIQDTLLDAPVKGVDFPFSKIKHESTMTKPELGNGTNNESTPRVLIIEDNPDVVAYMVACLQDQYSIQVGANGQEGIDIAVESIPDLIITDVMMPIKDGFEVTKFLKTDERTSHIPVIMLTAKADVASKLEGLKRGADAYLAKPFDKEELTIRMEQLILIRQKLAARYATGQISTLPPTQDEDVIIEDAFLMKINGFIYEQLGNSEYGVGELIKDAGMSQSQLYRKLKALTNRSVVAYIRLIRLQESLQLLKQSDKNISEIAYDVGFTDPAYFTRVFTQEFGKSPVQYQEDEQ